MEYLNGPQLFDSMFADDIEASKLAHLPGVATLLESYPSFFILLSNKAVIIFKNDVNRACILWAPFLPLTRKKNPKGISTLKFREVPSTQRSVVLLTTLALFYI